MADCSCVRMGAQRSCTASATRCPSVIGRPSRRSRFSMADACWHRRDTRCASGTRAAARRSARATSWPRPTAPNVLLAASPHGKRLAIASHGLQIAETQKQALLRIDSSRSISGLAFAPDGTLVAGRARATAPGRSGLPPPSAPGYATTRLCSGSGPTAERSHLRTWAAWSPLRSRRTRNGWLSPTIDMCKSHRRGASELRDAKTLDRSVVLPGLEHYDNSLAFADAGTLIAADESNGALSLGHRCPARQRGATRSGVAVAPSPCRQTERCSRRRPGTRSSYGISRPASCAACSAATRASVDALAFSPDGKWLASGRSRHERDRLEDCRSFARRAARGAAGNAGARVVARVALAAAFQRCVVRALARRPRRSRREAAAASSRSGRGVTRSRLELRHHKPAPGGVLGIIERRRAGVLAEARQECHCRSPCPV